MFSVHWIPPICTRQTITDIISLLDYTRYMNGDADISICIVSHLKLTCALRILYCQDRHSDTHENSVQQETFLESMAHYCQAPLRQHKQEV